MLTCNFKIILLGFCFSGADADTVLAHVIKKLRKPYFLFFEPAYIKQVYLNYFMKISLIFFFEDS